MEAALAHSHARTGAARATPTQLPDMEAFLAWADCLTLGMFSSEACVSMLELTALRQAEKLEAEARTMEAARWLSWLHEGPALRLRRQHRLSAVAGGWIPCPATDPIEPLPEEPLLADAQIDGLTPQQLRQVALSLSAGGGHAGAQQHVELEAKKSGVRSGWLPRATAPTWPSSGIATPPLLRRDDLLAACHTFPAQTGLGWGALHPRAFTRLSTVALDWVLGVSGNAGPSAIGRTARAPLSSSSSPSQTAGTSPLGCCPCWSVFGCGLGET